MSRLFTLALQMDHMSVQHYLLKESLTTMPAIIFVHPIAKSKQDANVSKQLFLLISQLSQRKVEVSREDSKSVYASPQSDESLKSMPGSLSLHRRLWPDCMDAYTH